MDNCSAANESGGRRDNIMGKVYTQIMRIESRLLLCSLYTVGVPPSVGEAVATLVNMAQLDRPEDGIDSLSHVFASSIGPEIYEVTRGSNSRLQYNTYFYCKTY